jgi:hypothetical protein
MRFLNSFLAVSILIPSGLISTVSSAQVVQNPKLSKQDLETAQKQTNDLGGAGAELIYSARIDAIQKGSFDSLVVIYAKPAKNGKDYYAVVVRDGKNYPLAYDKQGRALKSGDRFLRIGLKHESGPDTGNAPLLRLMAATSDPAKGEQQRNLDYRFTAGEFLLKDQSMTQIAK